MLFDHVDLRVRSLAAVRPLLEPLLAGLGYGKANADDESVGFHAENESGAEPFLWLVQDTGHRPNATRLAFHAPTRAEVDRLSELAAAHGARAYEPPAIVTEYGPAYYASFF